MSAKTARDCATLKLRAYLVYKRPTEKSCRPLIAEPLVRALITNTVIGRRHR